MLHLIRLRPTIWLDLFNMPVAESYPISEPLSTAGRVNMNYQIVPFTYTYTTIYPRLTTKSNTFTVNVDATDERVRTYQP